MQNQIACKVVIVVAFLLLAASIMADQVANSVSPMEVAQGKIISDQRVLLEAYRDRAETYLADIEMYQLEIRRQQATIRQQRVQLKAMQEQAERYQLMVAHWMRATGNAAE